MADGEQKRRRFPRIRAEHPVHVNKLSSEPYEASSKTATIGMGGCMFYAEESIGPGALVDLLISVRPQEVIEARGRVAYEKAQGDESFEVGVEFFSISDNDLRVLNGLFEGRAADLVPEPGE